MADGLISADLAVSIDSAILGEYIPWADTFTAAATTTYKDYTLVAIDSTSKKLIPYVKGTNTPIGFLLKGLTSTSAGDYPVNCVVMCKKVDQSKLVIHADGNASNIDNAVRYQLAAASIYTEKGITGVYA